MLPAACCQLPALFHEPVTEADNRFDLLADHAELATQASDVDVHRTCFDEAIVAPDTLEETIPRQHAIAVLDEIPKQLEFAPRQAYRFTVDAHRHGVEIGVEMLALVDGGRVGARLRGRAPAQHRAHACGEL